MSFGKMLFYDWAGGNEALFKLVNGNGGQAYDTFMVVVSKLSHYQNFPYYFVLMGFCALLDFTLRKLKGRGGANHCLIAWLGALIVMVLAYMVDAGAISAMKHYFQMPRPYVALGPEDVTLLEFEPDRSNDYHSFPSGHVAFVTMMVVAFWPVLSSGMRKFGLLAILLVAWSRMAVGMHFPADVLYAALVSTVITYCVRWFTYRQLLRFNIKC